MPANAANRMSLHLAQGKAIRFMCQNGRKAVATAELRSTDRTNDLSVQFQRAKHAMKATFTATGTASAGNMVIEFGGEATGNIAYNATAQTFCNNVRTALEALDGLAAYDIIVTGDADAFTVILNPKAGTGTFDQQTNVYVHPLDETDEDYQFEVTTLFTGHSAVAVAYATWEDVDPDGHNAAIVVKPYGKKVVAFGSGADENNADNLLGPFFRIVTNSGVGIMEFSPTDETLNVIRI